MNNFTIRTEKVGFAYFAYIVRTYADGSTEEYGAFRSNSESGAHAKAEKWAIAESVAVK